MVMTMQPLPEVHMPTGLADPDPAARAHGERVEAALEEQIRAAGGWLGFDAWMQTALYAPGLGYYSAGSAKFSGAGDYTTAPELTPLFGQALARQVGEILSFSQSTTVLEFGAGSGALAAAVIPALLQAGIDVQYQILDVSADLKARQRARLANWAGRVDWLRELPSQFSGCVLANEMLDALPVSIFQWRTPEQLDELGVTIAAPAGSPDAGTSRFAWAARAASPEMAALVAARRPPLAGYRSELNLPAETWVRQMGTWLQKGAALLIDYGFPQREYYHSQRSQGTLMCHFRHQAHDQPLVLAGLQDITAHVDFTAMADAALAGGLDVLGYTSQARFLMNVGLLGLIERSGEAGHDAAARARALAALNTLTSEAEMGELFKVLALGRGLSAPLSGFARGDRRDRL